MSRFDVVIPTYNRVEKLKKCLASLRNQTFQDFNVFVVADNNCEATRKAYGKDDLGDVGIIFNQKCKKAPRIWNSFLRDNPNRSICFICDDVELDGNCFEELLKIDNLDDKLIGFNQKNLEVGCKAAMGFVGTKFADRFNERQVWCPDYDNMHVDGELIDSAVHFGAFFYAPQCRLVHHHPVTDVRLFDETHNKTREHAQQDAETRLFRQKKGLIWGRDYERLR